MSKSGYNGVYILDLREEDAIYVESREIFSSDCDENLILQYANKKVKNLGGDLKVDLMLYEVDGPARLDELLKQETEMEEETKNETK